MNLKNFEAWFVTGSQHLYGPETLKQVAKNAEHIARALDTSRIIPVKVIFKPVVKSTEEILKICQEANNTSTCIGIITWMHTFSPAKMWIAGLRLLQKPMLHLHTQFNRDIPWPEIDMDFMNLNQSAHGDREFGFIVSRMRRERKVVVGHWKDTEVQERIAVWMRAACGWLESQTLKIARFGDNMREVAVTEGDKVEAQMHFGWSVNGFAVGDLVQFVQKVTEKQIDRLVAEYGDQYNMAKSLRKGGEHHGSLREAARIELGLRHFLADGGFGGFTDTFENLHGLIQLPGLAVQRLMNDGYGFGAEGDWKMAAMLRTMKVMASGLHGGNSFMEDYTYHLDPKGMRVLGAHMLEICSSLAKGKPTCEIHPLSIGGKEAPVRLIFNTAPGEAINVSVLDMGNRFRILVNEVTAVDPPQPLPKLPTARVLWNPKPNLKVAAAAWIYAGGAHHTCYSQNLITEHLLDFAEMTGTEFLLINENTNIQDFKNQIRWNEAYYALVKGF